jgi:hypothetical protein
MHRPLEERLEDEWPDLAPTDGWPTRSTSTEELAEREWKVTAAVTGIPVMVSCGEPFVGSPRVVDIVHS